MLRTATAPRFEGLNDGVLVLGPADTSVETTIQIPDGFTPVELHAEDVPSDPERRLAILRAMHCSLVVSVRPDHAAHPVFAAGFEFLPTTLPILSGKSLTIAITRYDRLGDLRDRVERDETWRIRVWISGTQECADEVPLRLSIEEALDRYAEAVRNTQSVLDEPHSNAERHTAKVTAERAIEEKARDAVMEAISRLALGTS